MKGRIFRKLKSITSPTWNPSIVFHTSISPPKEHNNKCHTTLIGENGVKEDKPTSIPNANGEEKFVHSFKSKPAEKGVVFIHEQVQLLAEVDPSVEMVTSPCHLIILQVETPHDSISLSKPRSMEIHMIRKTENDVLKCPPGGKEAIILYTTSLRGIRKTFEDCNRIRFLLDSFRVVYQERDVSMHLEYREELWGMLGRRVVPPRLFVRGEYLGGADEVVGLHENDMLRELLKEIPLSVSNCPCRVCAGMRFMVCSTCNGSRKLREQGQDGLSVKCSDCNENGLVKCSVCS